jgi:cob(I)alamin adenosyltransferase
MSISTRTGDRGQTSLLYGQRVEKSDARIAACGDVDELNAALGLARAQTGPRLVKVELPRIQKDLVALMGGLTVTAEDRDRYAKDDFVKLTPEMLGGLDQLVVKLEGLKINFEGWATPGANVSSAALDVARTVCRRAERAVAQLVASGAAEALALQYLNRLSDVLWLMARLADGPGNS